MLLYFCVIFEGGCNTLKIKIRYIVLFLLICLCYLGWYVAENYISINVPEEVEEYCDKKYDIKSEWLEYVTEENNENSRVSLVSDGTVTFKVNRYYNTEGQVNYKDNYLGYKYESEIFKIIQDNISSEYDFSISIENSNFPIVRDGNIGVAEFCKNNQTVIAVNIVSSEELSQEEMNSFIEGLREKVRVSVIVLNDNKEIQHFATDEEYNLIVR